MRILYFAHARRAAGCSQEDISITAPMTPTALWDLLVRCHPELATLRNVSRFARGEDFLPTDAVLDPADEIALIPPVSGG